MRSGDVVADRFMIEQLAGSGGMGEVFRARDRQTGEPVAIKVLRDNDVNDVVRFEREVRILEEVNDPHIVRHLAHGVNADGHPYLVMEWLDGEDLGQCLRRKRMSPAEGVAMCTLVAGALGTIHARGIVHRDLKPSNIFLVNGRPDDIRLLDFGIAHVDGSTNMTGTGKLIGTFGYMSPEQANGTNDVDARADVFALGCVLFECITGEPAFGGTHPMAILTKILFENAPRIDSFRANMPEDLTILVDKLLAKNRNDRPRNGHAVAAALRAITDMPMQACDDTIEVSHSPALTNIEQRAVAVIFVGPPANGCTSNQDAIEAAARAHGAVMEKLLDDSLSILLSGSGVVTDLAAQAARCALEIVRCANTRRVVLAMGRGLGTSSISMGRAIDQAARLLSVDGSDNSYVVIDDAAVGLLDARFDVHDDSGVYVLVAERDVAEMRMLLGKPTPCVGRKREMRMLEGLFDDCTGDEPRAQAVLVTAPPGVGKSRLGREFLQRLRSRGKSISVWMARGEQFHAGSAFALAAQLVESAASIHRGESLEIRCEKLRARVGEHVHEADRRRVTEFLGELIGAPFSDENNLPLMVARSDAQLMNDQLHKAFGDFLAAECEANPVLVFLEDLHWGDQPTVEVLGRALGNLSEKSLFVFALARPEVHDVFPRLWAGRFIQEIGMNQLSKKASERLVRHVLGDRVPDETVQKIINLSEGNAFYLEELIRAAAEDRGDDLPTSVVAMVQSRIGALSDIERRLMRAASVFGETFWTTGVSMLLGDLHSVGGKLDERLQALVKEEVFVPRAASRFPNIKEYAFRHALMREGAYAMLTEADRVLGHRLAGEWLERHGETDAVVLARHFEEGEQGEKAAKYFLRAAEMDHDSGDSDAAVSHAKRGLNCGPSLETHIELLSVICEVGAWKFNLASIVRPFVPVVLELAPSGSKAWLQGVFARLSVATISGQAEEIMWVFEALRQVVPEPDAVRMFVFLCGSTAYVLDTFGRYQEADWLMEHGSSVVRRQTANHAASAYHSLYEAFRICVGGRGNPWDAAVRYQVSLGAMESIGDRRCLAAAFVGQAMGWWCLGVPEKALAELEHPRLPDKELGYSSDIRIIALCWHYADTGKLREGQVHAEQYVSSVQGIPPSEARGRWVWAEILRRSGQFEVADQQIQSALVMGTVVDRPGMQATLAGIRLAQGKPEEALAAAEEGMRQMAAMDGGCGFFRNAFLRLEHAEALEACGRHEESARAIEDAKEWLVGIAVNIEDEDYRKSYLENVPENRRIIEWARTSRPVHSISIQG